MAALLKTEGLHVRTGRWNIIGKPIVLLIDFSPFIQQKNEILAKYWEQYLVDSISGQWDYVEPCCLDMLQVKPSKVFTNATYRSTIKLSLISMNG
jgi:glycogen phosphorylase/synthase